MLIGLCGKAGSGKDEFAKVAVEEFGATRIAFADAVKEEVAVFLNSHGIVFEKKHLHGTPANKEELLYAQRAPKYEEVFAQFISDYGQFTGTHWSFTPRNLLQWYGTEYRRSQDPDYWVKRGMLKADNPNRLYVFSDVRFPNEVDALREQYGYLIKIERPGAGTISGSGHVSEAFVDAYKGWDAVIHNDNTLADYRGRCREVLEYWRDNGTSK